MAKAKERVIKKISKRGKITLMTAAEARRWRKTIKTAIRDKTGEP